MTVDNLLHEPDINIFPNPSAKSIVIESAHIEGSINLKITNMKGETLYDNIIQIESANKFYYKYKYPNSISDGIYYLTLRNAETTYNKVILINRNN